MTREYMGATHREAQGWFKLSVLAPLGLFESWIVHSLSG